MLTSTGKVPKHTECERYAVDNIWSFLLVTFANSKINEFILPLVHFRNEPIGASLTGTACACRTVKLFKV